MTYTCSTVITHEGNWFVARCVELGVASQGRTIDEAQENLKEAVELYLEDDPTGAGLLSKKSPLITTLQISHG